MPDVTLKHGTWLALCDGQKALLLENQGDWEFPKLETREVFKHENPPSHLQGSSPPGRIHSSAGSQRSATSETDFHEQAIRAFVGHFAEHLDDCVRKHAIRSLVLIAPAKALGMMRTKLSDSVRQVVTAELDRDYMNMPLYEIEHHLKRLAVNGH